ncbi:MAG: N-acetylmuramoyl-L-alanine amidase [Asticcacaulis sp.]|jgi:N-acetylmuramoyl-L-alanine amidase|uniref:N-acetylmuramoyl-L-alanine amidase n=1 Tax=Asticcacaulis sp. TaxID=1872648 RepID=UPI0025BA0649|nr:N-acetylmuramoyl-L-alanine amidase [Asticcacaulis sp.]MCA1934437.1 N-acetylmuramoyl-L-alanine amidase [Asticcacaulis sp.]
MRINTNHRLLGDGGASVPFVASPNVGGVLETGAPQFLIIHYTAGGTSDGAVSWFRRPDAKASAHLVIGHTGDITQMVPFNQVAWHAGKSSYGTVTGLNSCSVGIEIVNWGLLRGAPGNWTSYTGTPVPDSRVLVARHKNFDVTKSHGWEIYDEAQWQAVCLAASAIVAHYGISEDHVLGHEDIAPGRKQDPGPAFDMNRFRARIFGRHTTQAPLYEVTAQNGLSLRVGPGIDHQRLALLPNGQALRLLASDGLWWQVAVVDANGNDDLTGWVHSQWVK